MSDWFQTGQRGIDLRGLNADPFRFWRVRIPVVCTCRVCPVIRGRWWQLWCWLVVRWCDGISRGGDGGLGTVFGVCARLRALVRAGALCACVWACVCQCACAVPALRLRCACARESYSKNVLAPQYLKGTVGPKRKLCGAGEPKIPLVFTKNLLISFTFFRYTLDYRGLKNIKATNGKNTTQGCGSLA